MRHTRNMYIYKYMYIHMSQVLVTKWLTREGTDDLLVHSLDILFLFSAAGNDQRLVG